MTASVPLAAGSLEAEVSSRGGTIRSLRFDGTELLLRTPWADELDLADVPFPGGGETAWSAAYPGGWQPLLPSASDQPGMPFHGEAAWRRWTVVAATPASVELRVLLRTRPLEVVRRTTLSHGRLRVDQTFANSGTVACELTASEHIAWGAALLGPSTALRVDGELVDLVPWASDSPSGAFFSVRTSRGEYELARPDRGLRVRTRFGPEMLPVLVVWQEHRVTTGWPWWGRVDALGVEPSSVDFAGGIVTPPIRLEPGESRTTWVEVEPGLVPLSA